MFPSLLRHAWPETCAGTLWRRPRPATHISLREMAQFFAPNGRTGQNKSAVFEAKEVEITQTLNLPTSIYTAKRFLDPNMFYPDVEIIDTSILEAVLQITYEPFTLWLEICQANLGNPAHTGSFIGFMRNDEIHFGVVLREPHARFNPYHNCMIVLTLQNDLVKVYPQDITFSMYRVLDADLIAPNYILANRFKESYALRAKLVQILHQFMALVAANKDSVEHSLKVAYSNLANDHKSAPVCMLEITKFVVLRSSEEKAQSYFHQLALLMAIHLEMSRDSSRWMVPGYIPSERTSNLSFGDLSSNSVPPPPFAFANSVAILNDTLNFLQYDEKHMLEFNTLLESLLRTLLKYDELVLRFGIWDATHFKLALKTMMYAAIYPHPQLLNRLSALPLFEASEPLSRELLTRFLRQIGLYDNPQNPLTDPFLSAGLFGNVKKHSLIASSGKDLDINSLCHSASVEATKDKFADKFLHLRSSLLFFHDTTAYILPGPVPNLAISMEEINSRRFLINLHIADVASRLSPSSSTFAKWTANNAFLEHKPNFMGTEKSPLLPNAATRDMFFRKTRPRTRKDHFLVGDYQDEKRYDLNGDKQTCMSLTFEYNSYLEDPMKSLFESVNISFDTLQDFQFKALDAHVLEESLTGKLEPNIFKKLKLFKHQEPSSPENQRLLDPDDHYNLNFIYNALRRHFEARNKNYAISLTPKARPRQVCKSLSATKHSEMITTQILVAGDEEVLEKTFFLRSEAEILAGKLASDYCEKNRIPVFYEFRNMLDHGEPDASTNDEVLIKHDNILLPDFSASSYFQVPYGRDVSGHISTPAFVFASNFLGLPRISTNSGVANAALGLKNGSVNVVDATESMRAYLNQLQILQHVHFTQTANAQLFKDARKFSHLRALGYSLRGPMNKCTMEAYSDRLLACALGSEYLAARHRRYWVIKAVEQSPHSFKDMKCVVTSVSRDIDIALELEENGDSTVLKESDDHDNDWDDLLRGTRLYAVCAYCEQFGIEVDMLMDPEHGVLVGTELIALKVVYAEAVLGTIVMG